MNSVSCLQRWNREQEGGHTEKRLDAGRFDAMIASAQRVISPPSAPITDGGNAHCMAFMQSASHHLEG
jgi:hypothetical protein